ncbi:hypothetical protein EAX62_12760 [Tessaracoccus antarcticus]|uniref:Uncharacterized protein n=1 Tax=Tessaracoccus antarcticus TaxID=2479848 RepID=A0A3M0GNV3_9ACTN|nr:hypothetical protein EAX62_12760 [Tessaracoccus antarcticus]
MDVVGDLGSPGRRPGPAGRSGLGGAGPIFRTILSQPDRNLVLAQWDKARDELAARYPTAPALMDAAKAEVAMQTSHTLGLYPPTPAIATQNYPALSVVMGGAP